MSPSSCILIPVYNHALTAAEVARRASEHAPAIVIDDGSTDGFSERLKPSERIAILRFPENRGKGAALRAGFEAARERGFTHAVAIDADGQHDPGQIPEFLAAIRARPDALILGARDLAADGAPRSRRWPNAFSNFWVWVQTGLRLSDTQCGFRGYPLVPLAAIPCRCDRYDFELELLVRSAWSGVSIVPLPIRAAYSAETTRLSHYRPIVDFLRISRLNVRLTTSAILRRFR